jgi:hypothetical protein
MLLSIRERRYHDEPGRGRARDLNNSLVRDSLYQDRFDIDSELRCYLRGLALDLPPQVVEKPPPVVFIGLSAAFFDDMNKLQRHSKPTRQSGGCLHGLNRTLGQIGSAYDSHRHGFTLSGSRTMRRNGPPFAIPLHPDIRKEVTSTEILIVVPALLVLNHRGYGGIAENANVQFFQVKGFMRSRFHVFDRVGF